MVWNITFYVDFVGKQIRQYCERIKSITIKMVRPRPTTVVALAIKSAHQHTVRPQVEKYLSLNLSKNIIAKTLLVSVRGKSAFISAQNLAKNAENQRQISTIRIYLSHLSLFGFADYIIKKSTEIRYNMVNAQTANSGRFLLRNNLC